MFLFGFESGFVRDPVPWSLEGFKQVDISETQRPNPQAWLQAQRAGLWSPWLPGPEGPKKKVKKKKTETGRPLIFFFFFFPPPSRPPTRILWFRDLGFLFFALYALRARHIPGRSFQLRLHSLYYWFHTIYSMDFCGPHKNFFYIHQVDIRFLWNLCSQCETESRKTRACSVLFSVYKYKYIYVHHVGYLYAWADIQIDRQIDDRQVYR